MKTIKARRAFHPDGNRYAICDSGPWHEADAPIFVLDADDKSEAAMVEQVRGIIDRAICFEGMDAEDAARACLATIGITPPKRKTK